MTLDAQSRRLRELLEVLAGQRGSPDKRAVLVDELRALETRVNAIINTKATGAIAGAVQQISGDLAELDVRIQAALAEGQAANAAASAVADDLTAEAAALRTEIDALTVDYNAAQAAAALAESARQAAEAEAANALTSANSAANSASQSATSASNAAGSESAATSAAATAATSATNAQNSATAAASSASTATTKATEAAQSAAAATAAKVAAETAQSSAEAAETAAATSETNAAGSASTAANSATAAANSATQAGASATAAATSASTATTKASEASQSATAASQSATSASTSEASASTFAAQASTAATNAGTSAAAAATSQQLAASITSRGISVIEEQFLSDISANKWSRWSGGGSLAVLANEVYPIGKTWQFTLEVGQQSGMQTDSSDAQWRGPVNADAYYVEVEFTLVSGSLDAAGVVFDWLNTAPTVFRTQKTLASMMNGALIAGNVHVASGVFRKPTGFTGTFSLNRIYVMAGWSTFGAVSAKVIKFHRVTIRPATAEEQGLGEVATQIDAKVANEAAVRTSEDQALATQISTVSASVGSLSADVTSQANAIADLEGNASAMLAFRVKAGTSGAQLELVAADNPDGSVSVARIDASNILLNGSVTASQLATNELLTTSAQIKNGIITNAKIANAAVDTAKIASAAVTSAKIANAAINEAKISDAAITSAKISDLAVDTLKIQDNAVTVMSTVTGGLSLSFSASLGDEAVLGVAGVLRFSDLSEDGQSTNITIRFNGSIVISDTAQRGYGSIPFSYVFSKTCNSGTNTLEVSSSAGNQSSIYILSPSLFALRTLK